MAQIRRRNGAANPVLFRQCAAKTFRARRSAFPAAANSGRPERRALHCNRRLDGGGCRGPRCLVCFDTAAPGRAAHDRGSGARFRCAHALFAGYDVHQDEADRALRRLWGRAHRRPRDEQAGSTDHFRQCDGLDRARLAAPHLALGWLLFRTCASERDRLAHAIERYLGRL